MEERKSINVNYMKNYKRGVRVVEEYRAKNGDRFLLEFLNYLLDEECDSMGMSDAVAGYLDDLYNEED